MKVTDTELVGVKILEPTVYEDERGFFFESFNKRKFNEAIGRDIEFVQDNHSKSTRGVLRGLHYQLPPYDQGKLVRVISGEVYDVVVDLRRSSDTFGNWAGFVLSSENMKQIWVPSGFAHGFVTISASAELIYKTTNYYCSKSERSISHKDQKIKINWPQIGQVILSKKDAEAARNTHFPWDTFD